MFIHVKREISIDQRQTCQFSRYKLVLHLCKFRFRIQFSFSTANGCIDSQPDLSITKFKRHLFTTSGQVFQFVGLPLGAPLPVKKSITTVTINSDSNSFAKRLCVRTSGTPLAASLSVQSKGPSLKNIKSSISKIRLRAGA